MYRIRFHGRGGHGIKTASRILGTAFFREGFEVQDAPRYGAERRGAPIFAYVRAAHEPIHERGIIRAPDLVVVADETLVPIPAAGVLAGVDRHTVLLVRTHESGEVWRDRIRVTGQVLTLAAEPVTESAELATIGATCAGAAARLVGAIPPDALEAALRSELADLPADVIATNIERALAAYDEMAEHAGAVVERPAAAVRETRPPDWVELPFEDARVSAPAIHAAATSVEVKTGLWRTMRPVIDYGRCHQCAWICGSFCPDNAIAVDAEGYPRVDYDHCKGCLICVAVCPHHAIEAIPEALAQAAAAASAS